MTVKAAIVFKRKPGMDLEAFRSYWLNEHPKAVLKMPGLVRYCQNHPLPGGYRKGELACDGVAETWWEDMETLRRNAALPEFQALCEDEARFIDRDGMATLLVEEIHLNLRSPETVSRTSVILSSLSYFAPPGLLRGTHVPRAGFTQIRRYVLNLLILPRAARYWDACGGKAAARRTRHPLRVGKQCRSTTRVPRAPSEPSAGATTTPAYYLAELPRAPNGYWKQH